MGNRLEITEDFKKLVEKLDVNYKGSSFNPFKFHKDVNGTQVPVYFIGTPGLFVAIMATVISVLLMGMVKLNASFWVWFVVLIVSAILLRVALKIDKARQIRFFANDLLIRSYRLMNRYNEALDDKTLIDIKNHLREFSRYISDDVVEKQILIVENLIKEKGV
ncbi:hypothetical protein Calni_1557 [Calditerrivibrio nitroreducens DSM 19672]|uniref:Uncharacterized protein n=2 Tax=Calditerrivibrio nitroreducens TaxID=477976 RepID=E4TF25_CALNY|nr:hypothetical protein Calni_1557 [Calditerrivibrio nitroreducens DSM 19672]